MFLYLLAIASIYSYQVGIYNSYINYFWGHLNQIDLEISILIVPNIPKYSNDYRIDATLSTTILSLFNSRYAKFSLIETNDTKFG
jgi:uncharacterized UBP type Zn finger protein